ncbi:enoyl-CoA hydratase/isomerase family protein [Halomicrobium sp. LC1Hm]|uniref:enoyl-CoA hydratase/isomerase family protein n=1 Tax=Halomicrobium sp. LC1Hm TaxID=2610902 RepID=UPI0012983538|nr:enoyl-CoA hydratase/isomerase family protein [Halomicrobium sp. LC1Hm]QGA81434.1 Enoyl-CoA hydratase/carnithine racemase [Halomicrobium sp. LC1Hm]
MGTIRTERTGAVLVVTIDRPDSRNALTADALGTLRDRIADASAPVVAVRGAGTAFCAGADLDTVDALDGDDACSFSRLGQAVADALAGYDGATVAAIDGPARGGGVELALACDLRVCTPRSTFAESGVTLGLFGAWGGTDRLVDTVGRSVAMDLSLSGRVVDADEALRVGLVSRIVDDPLAVAHAVADNDAGAVRTIKGLLAESADGDRQFEREREAFATLVEARAKRKD